ncbi:unnamed protein product [Protopolystoma xenopodis]|uniref:Secreted protein n=1 Tax=Protopolystoma xenopodis TaxID=117903 RepID=A0A3S5AWD4_9PLAT|nr:unnamed protein product [Protopolystoma xenopodis]
MLVFMGMVPRPLLQLVVFTTMAKAAITEHGQAVSREWTRHFCGRPSPLVLGANTNRFNLDLADGDPFLYPFYVVVAVSYLFW